jgi:MscS family membrane protein
MFGTYIGIENEYLRAFVVFVVSLVVFRLILGFLTYLFTRLTSKTKTDLDDIIIGKSSFPLSVLSFGIAFLIMLPELVVGDELSIILRNLGYTVVAVSVGMLIYFIVDLALFRALKKFAARTKSEMDDNIVSLIHGSVKIALFVMAFIYVLDIWGVEIGPFLAGLGIAGLALALALQPILSNIFSGISVILDKSVRVNDLIYLGTDTKGKILKVGLRSTKIRTFDNELIIVPNNTLASSMIQNVALPDPKTRVTIMFGVAYGSDVDKVKKVVVKELKTMTHLDDSEDVVVRFLEMGDSALNFKAYFYVDSFDNKASSIDEANTKIYKALNKSGIEIPFPQMDVHLKKK